MKRLFTTFLLFLFFTGAGCIPPVDNTTNTQTEDRSVNLFGVIDALDKELQLLRLRFPDGGVDEVSFSQLENNAEVGLLASVKGERELSTRRIHADQIEIINEPNIFVTSPEANATVTSPLVVFGFARVFENNINWRIKNNEGTVVKEGFATTDARDIGQFGPFRIEIFLPAMDQAKFTLEVFEYSARDGSELDLISLPLSLLSTEVSEFNVYFGNKRQGSLDNCFRVEPVKRTIAQTSALGRASLLELLKGPANAESAEGYITRIPKFTNLNSISIQRNIAKVDFDATLLDADTKCEKDAVISEIKETLLQFPTLNQVEITIDGKELK